MSDQTPQAASLHVVQQAPFNVTSMPEILDLDELVPPVLYIRLNGKQHPVGAPSMKVYLQVIKSRAVRERNQHASDEEQNLQDTLTMIAMAVPTIGKDELDAMTPVQIMKLSDMIERQMSFGQDKDEDPLEQPAAETPSTSD